MVCHPPERLTVGELALRREDVSDSREVTAAVLANLDHLSPWMGWATPAAATESTQQTRLLDAAQRWDDGREYSFLLLDPTESNVLGVFGLHRRVGPAAIELGYWLTVGAVGRGYATRAARVLTDAALALDDVARVEIHCDEANARSKAVPARLGYRLDRIETDAVEAPNEIGRSMIWVFPPA